MKTGDWWGKQIAVARVQAVLQRDDGYRRVVRATCHPPLTPIQLAVAKLLSAGYSREAIAKELCCTPRTIKFHIDRAATCIPSDIPATTRIIAWYRGAPLPVLSSAAVNAG